MQPRVIVDPSFRQMEEVFSPEDLRRLHETADVVWGRDEPMPVAAAKEALASAVAVVCSEWRYGELPSSDSPLRAIIDIGGRFPDGLDYDQCFARNIRVMTAAPGFGPQVAEMALGLALSASRDIAAGDRDMRAGTETWLREGNHHADLLLGAPVGFIGFGAIGQHLKQLIEPFGCPITAYDPWLTDGFIRSHGLRPTPLPELIRTSRVIFVLAAPSSENRALLGRDLLDLVAPNAVLVLVSRAHVVDFDALTELVLADRFKAAIDVFPEEPLPPDHPIRRARSAVLTPHRAGSVKEGLWQLGQLVVDDLDAIVRGLPPRRLQVAAPELVPRVTHIRAE